MLSAWSTPEMHNWVNKGDISTEIKKGMERKSIFLPPCSLALLKGLVFILGMGSLGTFQDLQAQKEFGHGYEVSWMEDYKYNTTD